MTLIAAEAFPEEAGPVTVQLSWGARREPAIHVALRLKPTLELLLKHLNPGSTRILRWRTLPDYRKFVLPDRLRDLAWLIEAPQQRDGAAGTSPGTSPVSFRLFEQDSAEQPEIIRFTVTAGADDGSWNGFTVTLPGTFLVGEPEEAGSWFRELVRLWQPEFAVLDTVSSRALAGTAKEPGQARAGYLTWLSGRAFGVPPDVWGCATAGSFGDGTFFMVSEWSDQAVARLQHRLESGGMPLALPPVQDVPAMPPYDPAAAERSHPASRLTLHLKWGPRLESPAGVAARILPTLREIDCTFGPQPSRWWLRTKLFGLRDPVPVPAGAAGLAALIESPRQRDAPDSPSSTGTVLTTFTLHAGGSPEGEVLYEFDAEAGATLCGDNEIRLSLPPGVPWRTPGDAAPWFRRMVRIWQPESAVLSTWDANRNLDDDRYQVTIGYLTWLSAQVFGTPAGEVPGGEAFGDGTLFAAGDWSVLAIPLLWEHLAREQMLVPLRPLRYVLPAFPKEDAD